METLKDFETYTLGELQKMNSSIPDLIKGSGGKLLEIGGSDLIYIFVPNKPKKSFIKVNIKVMSSLVGSIIGKDGENVLDIKQRLSDMTGLDMHRIRLKVSPKRVDINTLDAHDKFLYGLDTLNTIGKDRYLTVVLTRPLNSSNSNLMSMFKHINTFRMDKKYIYIEGSGVKIPTSTISRLDIETLFKHTSITYASTGYPFYVII